MRHLAIFLTTSVVALTVAAVRANPADPCAPMPVISRAADAGSPPPSRTTLAAASLNMAGNAQIESALARWVRDRASDVVLLQEVGGKDMDGAAFVASLGQRLGYSSAYAPADRFDGDRTQGLAILSRMPIENIQTYRLDYHHLRFRSRCRIALVATVQTSVGPVRVANVHLDTRINTKERVAQLEPLLDALDGTAGPEIVGGDFNTMDVGWFRTMWPFPYVQHQAAAVRDRMAQSAFHTPFNGGRATFKFLGLPVRLDWIYFKDFEATTWSVDDVPYSDHRGVWAQVTDTDRPGRGVSGPVPPETLDRLASTARPARR